MGTLWSGSGIAALLSLLAATALHAQKPPQRPALQAPFDVADYFSPTGWIGDGEDEAKRFFDVNTAWKEKPRPEDSDKFCIRVAYKRGPKNFAGVYWQFPDKNWGKQPGRTIAGGASRVTFWAAGEKGAEFVQFRSGGTGGEQQYPDTFEATPLKVTLETTWRQYQLDLSGKSLSNVVAAFSCIIPGDANPKGAVFYLDDIRFQAKGR
jgi:hypothetical protein